MPATTRSTCAPIRSPSTCCPTPVPAPPRTRRRPPPPSATSPTPVPASWFRFRDEVHDLTGYPFILPVHQGRAGERVLFSSLLRPGQICLSNTHFDTTHANVELAGAEPRDLPCPEAADLDSSAPFKGNIDLPALEQTLAGTGRRPGRAGPDDHQQQRTRRAAGVHGQPGGGQPTVPPLPGAVLSGRRAVRRERVARTPARTGIPGLDPAAHRHPGIPVRRRMRGEPEKGRPGGGRRIHRATRRAAAHRSARPTSSLPRASPPTVDWPATTSNGWLRDCAR